MDSVALAHKSVSFVKSAIITRYKKWNGLERIPYMDISL